MSKYCNYNDAFKISEHFTNILKGPKGEQGKKGFVGPRGDMGLKGLDGPIGKQGIKGDRGGAGSIGFIGEKGMDGLPGTSGQRGESGIKGIKGPIGDKGLIGPPGLRGIYGLRGKDGGGGKPGPTGVPGNSGSSNSDDYINNYTCQWTGEGNCPADKPALSGIRTYGWSTETKYYKEECKVNFIGVKFGCRQVEYDSSSTHNRKYHLKCCIPNLAKETQI